MNTITKITIEKLTNSFVTVGKQRFLVEEVESEIEGEKTESVKTSIGDKSLMGFNNNEEDLPKLKEFVGEGAFLEAILTVFNIK